MAIEFKPAQREAVSLLIGLVSGTGGGKTFSAMRLATGLAAGKRFAVIDTEAGRANHYADQFDFDHGDLKPPFTPQAYQEAIVAADKAGYPVIVVDSASHEWAGEGGILDMQEAELERMAGNDWKKREQCKMAAWIKPKMAHKKMVQRLLQVRAHVILCFRAEEKVEMVKNAQGKMEIVPKKVLTGLDGWVPICEKSMPFELTLSFLLTANSPGYPKPIKLQEQHRPYFDTERPIDEAAGERLAVWAAGDDAPAEAQPEQTDTPAKLIADYANCRSQDEHDTLEARRKALWGTVKRRETKAQLKQASEEAAARLVPPPNDLPLDDALMSADEITAGIAAATTRSECNRFMSSINTFQGQEKETLLEQFYARMKELK